MPDLKLVEHYTSVQGEGPRVGVLTQFVRFAGCNMRCPGWPCDTQFAIEPKLYKDIAFKKTPQELAGDVIAKAKSTGARNICLTGGEPFLQSMEKMVEFIKLIPESMTLECFSNGSFTYPPIALRRVNFIMDWKLPGSGEANTKLGERLGNALGLKETDAIKFVVTDQHDLDQAAEVWADLIQNGVNTLFYVGAAWDRISNQEILEYLEEHKLPWILNVQIHKYIWSPEERGV